MKRQIIIPLLLLGLIHIRGIGKKGESRFPFDLAGHNQVERNLIESRFFPAEKEKRLSPTSASLDSNITYITRVLYGGVSNLWVQDNYVYINDGPTFAVFDISDPSNPTLLDSLNITPDKFFLAGNYAYVPDIADSLLRIIDITDARSLREVGRFQAPWVPEQAFLYEDFLYLVNNPHGLLILDVSNPKAPVQIGAYTLRWVQNVYVAQGYAYLAAGPQGLIILDVSDPTNPRMIKIFPIYEITTCVYIQGNYAYVGSYYPSGRTLKGAYQIKVKKKN